MDPELPKAVILPSQITPPETAPDIAQISPTKAAEQPAAAVAQRVVLYEEDPSFPNGKPSLGSVIWRVEPARGADSKSSDIAVRADIEPLRESRSGSQIC